MSDTEIKVRVKAYDEGFAAGMKSMQKEAERLQARLDKANARSSAFGSTLGSLKGALGALGLGLSAGTAAVEGFKRTIAASQVTADDWQRSITGMKAGVEQFFQTLSMGDWSSFIDGIREAIKYGERFHDVLDTLGDMQWAFSPDLGRLRNEYNDLYIQAQDATIPLEERRKSLQELQSKGVELQTKMKALSRESYEAYKAGMSKATGLPFSEAADRIYRETQSHLSTPDAKKVDAIAALAEELNRLERWQSESSRRSSFVGGSVALSRESLDKLDRLRAEMERIKRDSPAHYQAYLMRDRITDAERDEAQRPLLQGQEYERQSGEFLRRLQRLKNRLNEEAGQVGRSTVKVLKEELEPIRSGSFMDDIEAGERLALASRRPMTIPVKPVILRTPAIIAELEADIERLQSDLTNAADADSRRRIRAAIEKKRTDIEEMRGIATVKGGVVIPELPDPTEKLDSILNANIKLVDSFGSLGAAIGSISGASENAIVAVTQWIGTVLSAVGAAVPALETLAAAHRKKAAAQAADAAAGAGASVASIPIVGAVMAVSAIAGVIAALANIPKFATGGVVRGASHTGDKILARLNAGELVLNTAQQTRLGHILDRADSGGEVGRVEFKIRGEELLGVLEKHGRRASRT